MGSEWQVGMLYLRCSVQDWLLNKAYLGKGWESALPREELKAKYTDLPGHLIMQILDREVKPGELDTEDPVQEEHTGPVIKASNPATGRKWKTVEEIQEEGHL